MKNITYQCNHCERKYYNDSEIITLSGRDGYINYKNPNTSVNQKIEINNMTEMHFCNQRCFTNYFFNTEEK